MPCSKKDLCSACALCPWNFLYFDEHGGNQKAETTVCSSSPSIPRMMPGKDRSSSHGVHVDGDDDGEDHDSIPQGMFISRKEEDREAGIA